MTSKIYTKTYQDMGGVDFSGDPSEISPKSFSYLENMYRDYGTGKGTGLETVPGHRALATLPGCVYAIHPHPRSKERFLIHADGGLYPYNTAERDGVMPLLPLPGSELLRGARSGATLFDGRLYLLDGKSFTSTDGEGLSPVADSAYRPTVYSDGEPFEEPSLLTHGANEEYHLFSLRDYAYTTREGLTFTLLDNGACYVSGYTGNEEVLILPARVQLGLREHAVVGVKPFSFRGNTSVRELILSEGISELGSGAFLEMGELRTVVLPEGLTRIPVQCFDYCPKLTSVYLPKSLAEIGDDAFDESSVTRVFYLGSKAEFISLPGSTELFPRILPEGFEFHEFSAYPTVRALFPLHLPTAALKEVLLDGASLPTDGEEVLYRPVKKTTVRGEELVGVYLEAASEELLYGKTLLLSIELFDTFSEELALEGKSFSGSASEAPEGCTLLTCFDGRLFLSGNPRLPGTVFYTGRRADGTVDPSYIPRYNRFTDGDGRAEVRALLSRGDTLLVLTEDIPDAPAVFCHTPADTGEDRLPRIYPLTEGIGGVGCLGGATLFLGDALFLSRRGLMAVTKEDLSGERGLSARSLPVDARLLAERLGEATLFHFDTYLGISVGGRVYLADGRRRTADGGYDWYYLSGIGSFADDSARYRFVSGPLPAELDGVSITLGNTPLILKTAEEGYADGLPIYSTAVRDFVFSYAVKDGYAYPVNADGERFGGHFYPATVFFECGGLLFFGTENGGLHVFNTDKRDADGIIPRRYYTFAGHAYTSGCATRFDDCGLPSYRKSTVRSGGAVRLKAMTGGKVEVRVRTEEGVFRVADTLYGGRGDFRETDFAHAEFHLGEDTVVPLREASRRWIEKQLYFVSEEYQRPFGLLSVTYEYRVAGRIRS